jgi:glucose-1-phosphate cytidylyltransferase
MKVAILAGGLGTRFSEETDVKPKPMIEVGGRPILWHIMKYYSSFGMNDFIVCLGYRGYVVKEYFANYFLHMSDVTLDIANNKMTVHSNKAEPWTVTLVDTGPETMTGGRIKRIREYLGKEDFCLTYGDGLTNLDLAKLIEFHHSQKRLATVTAVRPPGRFGALKLSGTNGLVESFEEKPVGDGGYINGGFFVLSPKVLDLIDDEQTKWEEEPMRRLAKMGQLNAFLHDDFWQPMDTLRDKNALESLWSTGNAPWKKW